VLPEGRGRINPAGLAFYDGLIDALLEAGIVPVVTLYHWDLPAALDDLGGWLNPESADWFADYARVVFGRFDDRVPWWVTLNEPWVVTDAGYLFGVNAPGHHNRYEAPIATHNLLRAHGAAVRAYREHGRHRIGLVVNLEPKDPASDTVEDREAAARMDAYMNRQYLDPVYLGRYPDTLRDLFGDAWPDHPGEDFRLIGEPIDFLGVNWYTRRVTRHDPSVPIFQAAPVRVPGAPYTDTGWEVHPQSFTRTLRWVRERYGNVPILITENGAAFPDPPTAAAEPVEDPLRVAYLQDHLDALHQAMRSGVDVRGYFAWSLLDNFEWNSGYSMRFGIVHVDHATQKRTLKRSALVYRDAIRSHGASLADARSAR
jgi:beta-glucosidase